MRQLIQEADRAAHTVHRCATGATARSKAPVFVIGCSRSGTTLLYHMLLSSGNFSVYRTESQILTLLEPRFRPLHKLRNKRRMLNAWYGTRLYRRSGLEPAEIEPRIMAECRNGGDFLRIVMEEMCRKQGVERWAETTPEHLLYIRRIKETIPNALVVHVIRDGRDVALSWERLSQIRRFPWDRNRPAMAAAIYWEWIVNKGRQAGRTLGADYVEVHYEDLVREPAVVLRNLEPFLEHDLDYERITEVGIGSVSAPNTAFKDARSPIGRWMADLSQEELATVETMVGGTLQQLGYQISKKVSDRFDLSNMRTAYRLYFETKQYLKTRTPAGKFFVKRDLSWI
jgi:Sulfotransferase family